MKREIFLLIFALLFSTQALADTVRVSVQYKKYLYTCSSGEEILADDNTRTYTCKDGQVVGEGWYKDVGGVLSFTEKEYSEKTEKDLEKLKEERITARIIEVKNPPKPVEPTVEDYQAMIDQKLAEVEDMTARMAEKKEAKKSDVVAVKEKIDEKSEKAQEIADKK